MTPEELLRLMRLLSALESFCMAQKERFPDYLADEIACGVEILEKKIMENQK